MGFFQNTRKPEGRSGKIMTMGMNIGHSALSKWGLSYLSLKNGLNILEIGCGGGANVARLLKACPDGKVTGVDYSEVSVEKSKKVNAKAVQEGRCSIIRENVRELSASEGTFDLATAFETIYFWPGLTESFSQVHRVLRSCGRFLICNEADGENSADQKWEEKIQGMKIYKENEITACLKKAGFSSVTVYRNQKKHWICFLSEKQ